MLKCGLKAAFSGPKGGQKVIACCGDSIAVCLSVECLSECTYVFFQVTPLTAMKFAELVVKAGFPPGVVNILPGKGEFKSGISRAQLCTIYVIFCPDTSV